MSLLRTAAVPAHTHISYTHAHNQCRLMTTQMGKCTGFPQGHQGPGGFNWEDRILLPFSSSSSPSPACDNAVCILIHNRVTQSHSQSASQQAVGWRQGGGFNSQMGFFPSTNKRQFIIGSLSCCFLLVPLSLSIGHKMSFGPRKKKPNLSRKYEKRSH